MGENEAVTANAAGCDPIKRLRAAGQEFAQVDTPDPDLTYRFCEAVYDVIRERLRVVACSMSFQILRTAQEQEDAIHSALLRTFETVMRRCKSDGIRWEEPDTTLSNYFHVIAEKNLRKERSKFLDRVARITQLADIPVEVTAQVDQDLARAELAAALRLLVADEIDCALILMRGDKVPYPTIAERLKADKGCELTVDALRQRFTRARSDLKRKLKQQVTPG